jgi:hypothetical protein
MGPNEPNSHRLLLLLERCRQSPAKYMSLLIRPRALPIHHHRRRKRPEVAGNRPPRVKNQLHGAKNRADCSTSFARALLVSAWGYKSAK